ncbi:MAG: hypothetical protein GY821_09740 [Gammaproteobacteria bacterium]|nr:hypothetical protein [Gammaproteobacteria bacterium]
MRKRKQKKWAAAYKPGKLAMKKTGENSVEKPGKMTGMWLLLQSSPGPLNQSARIPIDVSLARQTSLWGVW